MVKIYLAAKYERMQDMQGVAAYLRGQGHEVTSRWVDGAEDTLGEKAAGALMDVEDVDAADTLILFSQPHGSLNRGGGRYWEFGYAYGRGKSCIVVGEREIIFCHLPNVRVISTLADL